MKNITKSIINLRSRISRKDAIAIYTFAVIDIALTTAVVGAVAYFFI